MNLINGYWTDDNGNQWDADYYTKDQALSAGLVKCRNMLNSFNCTRCTSCAGFDTQPQQYTTPKMGRDNRVNFLYWTGEKHTVTCGCFRGTLDELEIQVKEVHKEGEHFEAYMKQPKHLSLIHI